MAKELRRTGIRVIGEVPWGTHFCHFYETKQDLLDTLVPYFKAGLESNEFCVWVVSNPEPITVEEAKEALAQAVPDLDRHFSDENIEVLNGREWYLEENVFNLERVTTAWSAKLKRALDRGYDGMRVSGDTFWLSEKNWRGFFAYENQLNHSITGQPMTVLCTYPLAKSGAAEILDVVQAHQFAIARRQGEWEIIEAPELIEAKAKITRLNEELEQRVLERTNELRVANETLRKEITERQRVEKQLRARAADLAEAQRLAKIGNWIFNVRTNRVNWSEELYRIFEIEKGDFDARYESFVGCVHPEDQARVLKSNAQTRIEGSSFDIEYRIITPTGKVRTIHEVGYATQDEAGQVIRLFGTAQDITEHRRAEDALRKSEERFRQLAENIREVFWMSTPDFSAMLYISPAYESVWGRTCESLYQDPRSFVEGIHFEDRKEVAEVIDRDRERGFEVEYRVARPDGSIRWVRNRGFPIKDESGLFYRLAGIAEDVTERKQAESRLYAKEQEFRYIVEHAPDQIIRYDREFNRTYVNHAVAKTYGLPRGNLIGKPIGSVIRDAGLGVKDEELAQVRQRIATVFETGQVYEYELRWPTDVAHRFYSVRLFPERDLNGAVINVLGISRDITELKLAAEELKKEKEILEKIFDNIPVMIGFVGEDGAVKLVNREWERILGWTLKELQEQDVDIFTVAYPDPLYRQEVLDFVAAATGESVDLKIRGRDGRVIDAAAAVVRLSDGTRVAIAQDITERKQAEEALKQRENELAEAQHVAQVGSWSLDLRSNTVIWSEELYRIFGVKPSEFDHSYEAVIQTTHPQDRDWLRSVIEGSLKTYEPFSIYYRIILPTGELRILHAQGAVVTDEHGNATRLHGAAQDVTERMQAQERLRATTEQLRALSARFQSAKEEEDIRIAREIHDEMGSTLTSLRWELETFDRTISEAQDWSQLQTLRPKIADMMRLTDITIGTMRRIASELRPSILDDLGLAEAIEWQAQQFQTRTGIVCHCDYSLENLDFDPEQSTAIFRIFQEALTNVMRHARATRVEVVARENDGGIVLTISDNGRGIAEDEKSGSLSLGILGMRERAHLIGGALKITGITGRGTVVTVRVPISGKSESLKSKL